jgi:ADP-ribosylation factor GTPase-activating protein 2/3
MKIGGNASAIDFFTRHGGSALLVDSDTKKKYSSRAAELYKEELARRVKEDALKCVFIRTLPVLLSVLWYGS